MLNENVSLYFLWRSLGLQAYITFVAQAEPALHCRRQVCMYLIIVELICEHTATLFFSFFSIGSAIDGHWGRWSDWSKCSVTCGDGYRTRFRKCDNPKPMRGGLYCPGASTSSDGCVMKRCVLGKDSV